MGRAHLERAGCIYTYMIYMYTNEHTGLNMIIHTVIQDPTAHKIAEKSTVEVEGRQVLYYEITITENDEQGRQVR